MFPRLFLIFCFVATLTACRTAEPQPNGTANATASPAVVSDPAGLATPTDEAITVWTVPAFAPAGEDGEATAFGALLDAYRQANPELSLDVAVKPDYGPNGILSHLSSTAEVVPGNLPDVAIVPIGIITDTIAAGIAQPIVDEALVDWIDATELPVVVVIHANHPNEIDASVVRALRALDAAGATLLNQAVLLRGVNDSSEALEELSKRLFDCGVLPYYLHLLDRVAGAAHFEVDETRALKIMGSLQARLPGYLVPRLVREVESAPAKMALT